jgi:hypothetical protein
MTTQRPSISIRAQHLDGNDPEGFNAAAWVQALTSEYRRVALDHCPGAVVEVTIDRQPHTGAAAHVSVHVEGNEIDHAALEFSVEQAANWLYDRRGQEFYYGA